ncbi:MAG TPA: carbohydrate kinase family protein [Dehalococcoidia bacterium]|nr:carbohydrate kinase family protein [Dehalococcoidia bacterium]
MIKNSDVTGLGALNIDKIYKVERVLCDGEAVAEEMGCFPGGSAANTIYGLAMLGVDVGFIGAVGDDDKGKLIIEDLKAAGVNISQITVKHRIESGSTLCFSDSSGERSIYVTPGANSLLCDNDLSVGFINESILLHLSSFVNDEQFRLSLELVSKLAPSVKLSFSPGELYVSRGIGVLAPILGRTDILFINRKEVEKLTGKDFRSGAEACRKQGCRTVVVTLGNGEDTVCGTASPASCYIASDDGECMVGSADYAGVNAVDTTGAGDAFAAGFIYGLLKNKGLEECGHLGDITARLCVCEFGARQGLPTPTRLSRRYYELYNEPL